MAVTPESPEATPPKTGARVAVELPCRHDSPAIARRAMAGLEAELAHSLMARVRVVVTEMVSNCVWSADGGSVLVDVTAGPAKVRGEVVELDSEGGPRAPEARPFRRGGFGLVLVRRLADRAGALDERRGMWFEIDRPDRT